MRRWAALAALALGTACGPGGGGTAAVFTTPVALAEPLPAAGAADQVWLLDSGTSQLVPIAGDGLAAAAAVAVSAPPGGWPAAAIELFQTSITAVDLIVAAAHRDVWRSRIDVASGAQGAWSYVRAVRWVTVWDGALRVVSDTAAPGDPTLPADAAALPAHLSSGGFPYVTTAGAVAYWDPATAGVVWSAPRHASGHAVAWGGSAFAWVEADRLVTAPVARGAAPVTFYELPLAAPVHTMAYHGETLFVAGADGSLFGVVAAATPGLLCTVDADADDGGAAVGIVAFRDEGSLSDPRIDVSRVGRQGCPGWARTDAWTLSFEDPPSTQWRDLSLAPDATTAAVPFGQHVTVGDAFVAGDSVYAVTSVTPLRFDPPLPATLRGQLIPRDRWAVRTELTGLRGYARTDVPFARADIALTVSRGADAADPGDAFAFSVADGVDALSGGLIADWVRLAGGRTIILDVQVGAVTIADLESLTVYAYLR